jgi:hypothetical protein
VSEGTASRPGRCTPAAHWIGGWVFLRIDMDAVARKKVADFCNHFRSGLGPLVYWDRGFESHSRHVCMSAFLFMLSCVGRGLEMGRSPAQGVPSRCLNGFMVWEVSSEWELLHEANNKQQFHEIDVAEGQMSSVSYFVYVRSSQWNGSCCNYTTWRASSGGCSGY